MFILADIAQGKTGAADVFFLIAVILFIIVTFVRLFWVRAGNPRPADIDGALVAAGLACVALGLLLQ